MQFISVVSFIGPEKPQRGVVSEVCILCICIYFRRFLIRVNTEQLIIFVVHCNYHGSVRLSSFSIADYFQIGSLLQACFHSQLLNQEANLIALSPYQIKQHQMKNLQ